MTDDMPAAPRSVSEFIIIYRGISPVDAVAATRALADVGFDCFEVSLTSPDALAAIAALHTEFAHDAVIGAGTVRSLKDLAEVTAAGASLVLSPETDADVIRAAKEQGIAAIPGAATATEISLAHRSGADVVKLFPAGPLGVDYFRVLREPLPHVPLLVTGGVDAHQAREFFEAGAVSVGIGLGIIDREALFRRDWAQLARSAENYLRIARGETPSA